MTRSPRKSPEPLSLDHINFGLNLMTIRLRFAHESRQPQLVNRRHAAETLGIGSRRLASIEAGEGDVTYSELLLLSKAYGLNMKDLLL